MKGRNRNWIKKGQFNSIYTLVRILELVVIGLTIGITNSKLKDLIQGTTFTLKWILCLMLLIGSIYFLLVVKEYINNLLSDGQIIKIPSKINISRWRSDPKSIKEKFDINRIVVLMYLIIFCFSLFAVIAVFKNNQPIAIIPKLPRGTIGLRSFGCKIVFSKIEISYLDSNGIWQMIPTEVTNDSNNWKHAFKEYNDSIKLKPPGIGRRSWNYSKPKKDSLLITLNNSGVKFNPANPDVAKYFKNVDYFKISTFVKVDTSYAQYADIQICMNVTTKSDKEESEELYLGFSLPVTDINNAKFWIPALVWRSGNEYRDPISKLNSNGIYDDLSYGVEYNFIAVSFFNTARIYLRKKDFASIICESKFESSKGLKRK